MNKILWTPHQDAVLQEMYGDRPLVDIAARIGNRSPDTIRRRASALGLKRDSDFLTKMRRRARGATQARAIFQQTILPADAEPISSSADDHPWNRASRENNEQFLELLQQEFLTSG